MIERRWEVQHKFAVVEQVDVRSDEQGGPIEGGGARRQVVGEAGSHGARVAIDESVTADRKSCGKWSWRGAEFEHGEEPSRSQQVPDFVKGGRQGRDMVQHHGCPDNVHAARLGKIGERLFKVGHGAGHPVANAEGVTSCVCLFGKWCGQIDSGDGGVGEPLRQCDRGDPWSAAQIEDATHGVDGADMCRDGVDGLLQDGHAQLTLVDEALAVRGPVAMVGAVCVPVVMVRVVCHWQRL